MARYAVCIGINDYPGTDSDLRGCVNDANDWAAELERRGFDVKLLLDAKATKERIVGAMKGALETARSGDVVVFTYSGHGTWVPDLDGDEPDRRDEALCPHDLASGPLVDDELHDIFSQRARGTRVIFLSDSCHSGSVAKFHAAAADSPQRTRFLPPEHYERFLGSKGFELRELRRLERTTSRGRSRAGALLISGCADIEYSYDASFGGRPNGAFTWYALEALKGLEEDGSYRKWYAAIRERLPSASYPQTPNLVATSGQRKWKVFE